MASTAPMAPHVLVYFIPGNPGYIGYYSDFFAALKHRLSWAHGHIHLAGRDLAGFQDEAHAPFSASNPPYDVEGQIQSLYKHIASLRRHESTSAVSGPGKPYDVVILAGHSVGSYIALEIFHRHLLDPSAAPHLNLHSGILLFPTVTHIAQSPSGRRLSLLSATPVLRSTYHLVARAILLLWPRWVLHLFVSRVMRFSDTATDVTVDFLKSRDGVWQALHMGQDEMRVIKDDKWDDALWEMPVDSRNGKRAPKFALLFGQNDHWVSDHFRANFIRAREKHIESGWARIVIDETGLPHAFCVTRENSDAVAERVAGWLGETWHSINS